MQGDADDVVALPDEPRRSDGRVDTPAHGDENSFASDHGPHGSTPVENAAETELAARTWRRAETVGLLILQGRSDGLGPPVDELGDEIDGLAIAINAGLQRNEPLGRHSRLAPGSVDRPFGDALAAIERLAEAAEHLQEWVHPGAYRGALVGAGWRADLRRSLGCGLCGKSGRREGEGFARTGDTHAPPSAARATSC